jgi:transmembrane sensor
MKAPENLHLLINKYLAGHANEEEINQLHDWYRGKDHSHVEWPVDSVSAEADVYQRMLLKIDAGLAGATEQAQPALRWYKMMAAAVILIVASVGGYLFFNSQKADPLETLTFKNDIAPAGNKTILKLANGTEIALDDAKAGELAQQGGIRIIKNADGQLIYDLSAAAGAGSESGYNTIVTPIGGQYQVVLSDGTKAWLNALSSLRFPTHFGGKERDVETSGEVYFEVAKAMVKDKTITTNVENRIPFIVKSNGQQVEVLGTHFNVNAYGDEGVNKTTLLEGSIKISAIGSSISKVLKPGQQAYVSGKGVVKIIDVDTDDVIAWKSNLFQFNNTPIDQVMQQVKRWYDIEVVYSGAKPDLLFTGVIPKNNNISILLKVLESTGGVKFGIEGKKVIIQSSPIKSHTDMKDR